MQKLRRGADDEGVLGPGRAVQDGQDRIRAAKAGAKQLPAARAHQRPGGPTRSSRGVGSGERVSETREERRSRLVDVFHEASECTKCPLSETRTNVVFGAGNADASLMFVGEAPGAEEDRQGLPFVGRAGALLTELLAGIGMERKDVWICNVLKCRPPGNRDPQPIEIESCEPYLFRQVELIEPRVVATLGNFATKLLTGSRVGITRVRGTPQVREIGARTVFLLPLLHPAAALRTPSLVDTLREDFSRLPELIERPLPEDARAPTVAELAASGAEPPADQLDLFG
jgi:uracil-DNA glycosylase